MEKNKNEQEEIEIKTIRRGAITWYDLTCNFNHIKDWYWKTVIAVTPRDNKEDTLFHAIALSFFSPYITGVMNGERINKDKIVNDMRMEMSQRLCFDVGVGNSKVYDLLRGGHGIPVSFDELYAQFIGTSNTSIYMLEHISNCIHKDIYIYDQELKDIWLLGDEEFRIKGRPSIVLHHNKGIFDVIGVCKNDEVVFSHFSPDNEFILFLNFRLKMLEDSNQTR